MHINLHVIIALSQSASGAMFDRTSLFSRTSTAFIAAVAVALAFASSDVARAQAQVPEVTGEESLAAFGEAVRSAGSGPRTR